MKDKPNEVTATLKVVATGEFYDDDATEELLRYAIEQDLEDSGFDVDVSLMEDIIRCKDCKYHYNMIRCSCGGYTPDNWYCAGGKQKDFRE